MRDAGLEEAIRAAGGVGALAQKIGISQPSVSNWSRVPADRVVSVEAVTGVARDVLRPDLYGTSPSTTIDEVDAARAAEYALLSVLLARAPNADMLARLARLRGDASPLGLAHAALAEAAATTTVERAEREYFNLFIGIGRGEVLPYGSYYLTGFLNERPLARLREELARLGIERSGGKRRARGSCRDRLRDHGRHRRRKIRDAGRGRSRAVRAASRAVARPVLCGSRARRRRRSLPANRSAGSVVHIHRERSFRAAVMTRAARRMNPKEEAAMKRDDKAKVGRRDFLRVLGAGAGAAAVAPAMSVEARADSESNDEKKKARYKETDHVKAYYRVNRYPG